MRIEQISIGALVDPEGRILLTRRPNNKKMAKLWEFPGGKIENNELPDEALIRELKEELSIETRKSCLAPVTFVLHKYKDFHAILFLFICRRWNGIPNPLEGQEMTWVRRTELKQYQMPEANSFLVAILRDWI